jgi:hypothetical protein
MKNRDPNQIEYQPPGSSEWQPVEKPQNDLSLARRFLAEGEGVARVILRRSREQERSPAEVEELERDMAAALGSFERMVAAGARKLKFDAEDLVSDLRNRKK